MLRRLTAVALCWICAVPLSWAQAAPAPAGQTQASAPPAQNEIIAPQRPTSIFIVRPYQAVTVPPVPLVNSSRLSSLIQGGKLYLTVQDAIALALENNIDVEVARYTPILDEWNLVRASAGGALPGVPSASTQASSVTRGEGVRGSQAAAGVSTNGGGGNGTNTVNATITQIGPVTPTLDPVFQDTTTFSHSSFPQANIQQSLVVNLIDKQRNYNVSLQSGFLSGTQASMTFTEGYLNENSPTDILNPQYAPTLSANVTQQFLQGFGVGVNRRTIDIDKVNLKIDDLNFKTEVTSVVVNVLNLYYGLVADYEDLKAKQSAVDVARQFYENNKKQVELGALAPLDVTSAESQVALSEQDLVTAHGTLAQQQVALKNAISRIGSADPRIENADIIPLDHIDVPEKDDLPPIKDLVAKAMANRADIEAEKMHLTVDELNALGTRNGVLPILTAQVSATNQGLAGAAQSVPTGQPLPGPGSPPLPHGFEPCPAPYTGQICELPDPYFVGGLGNAVGQVFRRNFPSQSAAVYMSAHLRNRQAQADYAIDQLSMRQDQLQTRKDVNQVAVDVANQSTALQQARVRYLAAVKHRVLEQQLLDAEQKKFGLGASTPYNVVTQQRDLATGQSSEVAALVAYGNALVALGQTVGTTLEDVHVSLNDAKTGTIARQSGLPQTLPAQP
ncbi:MAG TPA: TolC family protein [Bryobacteraceae bacterium]|jgi:outer membrane protein TolC|nr:TolC family protein [Bryobacteraceae bacterium]